MKASNKFRQERNEREDDKRAERFAVSEIEYKAKQDAEYALFLSEDDKERNAQW